MERRCFCTVCTPTYNRRELLEDLYISLKEQTCYDFEWIVVDDGSTDDTEDYITNLIENEKSFDIKYLNQVNGGKHRAVNKGIDIATGNVFAIVDSDDKLVKDAIEKIKYAFLEISSEEKKFAGVAFQKGKREDEAIGTTFKGKFIDAMSIERQKFNISGDKFEVFYTDILKQNKFPEIDGEKFMTEAVLWTRIASQGYIIRWYNSVIYIANYLEGGLTDGIERQIAQSPRGYSLYISEQKKYAQISVKQKISHYSFYCMVRRKYSNIPFKNIANELNINLVILLFAYILRKFFGSKSKKKEINSKLRSRTVEAMKNVIFNFSYQVINTITNILLPPLIISMYGSAINGLISTIKQIINYIQLVGAGISESTIVELYKPLATGENEKVSSIYKACEKMFNRAGRIFSIIALLVAFIYPIIINENLEYSSVVKIILALSISGASEFFVLGKCRTLLIADQKNYVVNIAQIIGSIFSTCITIILIKLNCIIELVQLFASLTYILRIVILLLYIKKNYKFISRNSVPNFGAMSKRKDATVHQLSSLIIFGSQTLFISKFCGLVEASVYSCYSLVFTGISTILSTFSSAMLAGIGNIMATDSDEKVRKIYRIYEYLYYILVFICYAVTFIMILPFINLYVGDVVDANYNRPILVVLFTILGILNCIRTPGATIINAKGHYKETKNRALIEMMICLLGQVLLVGKFKVAGVLIATIFSSLYRSIDVIIYSNKRILNQSAKKTILNIFVNVVTLVCLLFMVNVNLININSYVKWILCSVVIFAVAGIVVGGSNIIFHKNEYKETKEYLVNILKNRRKSKC